jgi:nitrite reductase/ring-hydroxylating ferredoxin subunit
MTQAAGDLLRSGRRRFLRWATAVGGVLSAALAGIPAARAFLSPAFRRPREEKWIKLGEVDAFDTEQPTKVDFVDTVNDAWVATRRLRNVWVYTEDGETFKVYNGRCTHLGCNYSLDPEKNVFRCPCHIRASSTSRPAACWAARRRGRWTSSRSRSRTAPCMRSTRTSGSACPTRWRRSHGLDLPLAR